MGAAPAARCVEVAGGRSLAKLASKRKSCYARTMGKERAQYLSKTRRSGVAHDSGKASSAMTVADSAVPRTRFPAMVQAANEFSPEEFEVLERLLELKTAGLTLERRRALSRGFSKALQWLAEAGASDALAGVDEPMDRLEADRGVFAAEAQASVERAALLNDCISAAEAGKLVHRSRQSIENLRRQDRVLALRARNKWLYPAWQFDPDASGGVVRGLSEVMRRLHLSPSGVALWLTLPSPQLRNRRPIELLRRNQVAPVVRLAEEQGYRP